MAAVERGDPNPIWFDLPDGSRGRVWLAHEFWLGIADAGKSVAKNRTGRVKIGDERHWRVAGKVDRQRLARSPSTPSLADIWATELEQYSPQRELAGGSTPGALQGGDYTLEYDADGYPVLPACLDRPRTKAVH